MPGRRWSSIQRVASDVRCAFTVTEIDKGRDGLELIVPELGKLDFGIVGEPTQMHLAIAEKGLMVLDCTSYGKAGHAAREEGENAMSAYFEDLPAGFLRHGHGFTCDVCLVQRAATADDPPVRGHAGTGPEHDDVINPQLGSGNFGHDAV